VSLNDTGKKSATIPFRFKKRHNWVVHIAMRKKYAAKDAKLAVGGIPATVAIRSQMIPLKIENIFNGLRAQQRGSC